MPELGKATYSLILNSAQFNEGLAAADERAAVSSTSIQGSLDLVDAGYAEAGVAANAAADEVAVASEKMAVATEAGAAKAGAAMTGMRAKFLAMGKVGKGGVMMAGALAGYLFVKGGINYIKNVQDSMLQVNNAVKNTGRLTGVTTQDIKGLAEQFTGVKGQTYAVNLQTASMLARMTNLRNLGPGIGMVYNRAFTAVQDMVAGTGKSAKMMAIAVGKAMQDPVKNVNVLSRAGIQINKDLVAHIFATQGPLAAQNYILGQIEQKYGGAAKAALKGFTAQWTRFKEQLDKIAATVLRKLIPAFTTIGGFLNRHPALLRALVYALLGLAGAYMAVKIAAALCNTAMALGGALNGIARLAGFGAAVDATAAETVVGTGIMDSAFVAMGMTILVATGYVVAMGLAIAGVAYAILHMPVVGKYTTKLGNWLGGVAANATGNSGKLKPGDQTTGQTAARNAAGINKVRARYQTYVASGMTPKDALMMMGRLFPQYNAAALKIMTGNAAPAAAAAAAATKRKYGVKGKPSDFTTGNQAAPKPGVIPNALQEAALRAEAAGNKTQELTAYRAEAAYLTAQLSSGKLAPADQLKVQKSLTAVDKKIATLLKVHAAAAGVGGILGKLPGYNQLAFNTARAATTKGLKDDRKALTAEEAFLQGIVNNRKYSLAIRTKAATELKSVLDKLKAVNKSITDGVQATAKEIQASMDLRGTFFGQFAGDVFGQGASGLTVGAQTGGGVAYNQNNTFNEIPKDRHALARQARAAAVRALST